MKSFLLSAYISHIEHLISDARIVEDFCVSSLSNNSRETTKASIFVAVKGSDSDGHQYIPQAISSGAMAVVHSSELTSRIDGISYIRVADSYYAYALLCEKYFDEPAKKLKLIGVTGTNGKTTSVYLLKAALEYCGKRTGLISTVEYSYPGTQIKAERTTPEANKLQKLFCSMVESGCEYCVMEVSSHALDQRRMGGARFDGTIFTNLSGDHLDYHKNMENYFRAKSRLFSEYLKESAVCAFNADDKYSKRISAPCRIVTFGINCTYDYSIIPPDNPFTGCLDAIGHKGLRIDLKSGLIGMYNAYNVTGVFALLCEMGFDELLLSKAFSSNISVQGRLERVFSGKNILFFVDYAHTDDALKRVLTALRKLNPEKLICVFGCGGNRDKTKRPRMGKISTDIADFTIITSDNPRNEKPDAIIDDIIKGIKTEDTMDSHSHLQNRKFCVVTDRKKAIFEAVRNASENDIVLIAGKGHEDYQEINGVKSPFSDILILRQALEKYNLT